MSLDILPSYEPESGSWSYLLIEPEQRIAALLDPVWVYDPVSGLTDASFVEAMLAEADRRGCRVEWVLETHAHADHLTAADLVRKRTGARIGIGRGIRRVQENFKRVFNLHDLATDGRQFDRLFAEDDTIWLGAVGIRVMETPGHTSDSVTYLVDDAAFVGDTLFAPHYGSARCDFPGGDAGALYDSIQRLHALPDGTKIYLCHDYPGEGDEPVSNVPVEVSRATNVHVGPATSREEYVAMRTDRDAGLPLPRLILPAIQVNIRAGAPPPPEDNGVGYLRIPFDHAIPALIAAAAPGKGSGPTG